MKLIIDVSGIRKNGSSLINDIKFEYKMKKTKGYKCNMGAILSCSGIGFAIQTPCYSGIYSYEMMNQALTTGDFINAVIFGLLPVLQGIKVDEVKMINTYIKEKISA